MKFMTKLATFLLAVLVMFACKKTTERNQPEQLILTNPTNLTRLDEPITIKRDLFTGWFGNVPGQVPVITKTDGKNIPLQLDDLNGDGEWDEVAMVANFEPNQTLELTVVWANEAPDYPDRTNVALFKNQVTDNDTTFDWKEVPQETIPEGHYPGKMPQPYQSEGPMWENDRVAFRHYFDERHGRDIFGKKTFDMVIEKIGADPVRATYHEMRNWGMDVLKTGTSLGAGAIGMVEGDSLYRIGKTQQVNYKKIVDGPVRSIFELEYTGWMLPNKTLNFTHKVCIWAGKYWYGNHITFDNLTEPDTLIAGITTMKLDNDNYYFEEVKNADAAFALLGTHGKQTEPEARNGHDHHYLGMGIMVPAKLFIDKAQAPDSSAVGGIVKTYYAKINAKPKVDVKYRFFAGWERGNPDFASDKYFYDYMKNEALKATQKIEISAKGTKAAE